MTCSSCPPASASAPVVVPLVGSVLAPEDIVKIFFAAFKLTLPLDILTAISFSVVEIVSVFVILNESVEEFVAFLKAQGFSDIKLSVATDVTTVTALIGGLRVDLGKNDDIPVLPNIILTPSNLPDIFVELFILSIPKNVFKDLLGIAVEFAVVFLTQDKEVDNLNMFLNDNGFGTAIKALASDSDLSGSTTVPGSNGGVASSSSKKCTDYTSEENCPDIMYYNDQNDTCTRYCKWKNGSCQQTGGFCST